MPHPSSTGTLTKSPPRFSAIHMALRSFSSALNVQVEYMSSPPGRRQCHTSLTMSRCSEAHSSTLRRLQSATAPSSLRNIPSPEQGTSANTTSNVMRDLRYSRGKLFVTTTSGCPNFCRFSSSTLARWRIGSLAKSILPCGSTALAAVLLPPGAAQRSSISTGLSTSWRSTWHTNIDDASCT